MKKIMGAEAANADRNQGRNVKEAKAPAATKRSDVREVGRQNGETKDPEPKVAVLIAKATSTVVENDKNQ